MSDKKRREFIWIFTLLLSLILVCLPRFNRQDMGLRLTPQGRAATEVLGDADEYIEFVRWFRGTDSAQLRPPFAYRPLAPFLASLLPFAPMTALNVVNVTSLLIALLFLHRILAWLEVDARFRILGLALFVFSFPTFYYGAIGFVDPVLICFLMVGTYVILTERWLCLLAVLVLGALTKETIVLLLPVLGLQLAKEKKVKAGRILLLLSAVGLIIVTSYLARDLSPVADVSFGWLPNRTQFFRNIGRARSWLSFLLGFGIPGFLSTIYLVCYRREILKRIYPLIAGFFTSVALFGYAMTAAYADGRFIWPSMVFSVPLATLMLQKLARTSRFSILQSSDKG